MAWMSRIKPRKKARPGRLKGEALAELRLECYQRDKAKCVDCGTPLRWESGYPDSMHMAHVKCKRMAGDNIDNVKSKCFRCHILIEHLGGKVVPKKVRV